MMFFARFLCLLFFANTAQAAVAELPFPSEASHFVLMDAGSGTILASREPDAKMYPSSMTKLMTLYILFEELKSERIALDTEFIVSEKAWAKKGSKMFVPLGEAVSVENLVQGIAVQSGNDACIVAAEGISGSEAAFAVRMNQTAKTLGMDNTNFVNSSGWPDENHYTSAHDLAILAQAMIRDYPEYYPYLAEPEFTYNNIRQYNRNRLLGRSGLGVDGLKTGHTEAAGYGIVLSAKQSDSERLILVINGLPSEKAREEEGADILGWGFATFAQVNVGKEGAEVARSPVRYGKSDVSLVPTSDVNVTVLRTKQDQVTTSIVPYANIEAPIEKGKELATLEITVPDAEMVRVPLVAGHEVARKGFFGRMAEKARGLMGGK